MGAGASAQMAAAKGLTGDALKAKVEGLSSADKAKLKAALPFLAPDAAEGSRANASAIAENEANLHSLHLAVLTNKQGVYEARSMIEENRNMILQNYAACFTGNRQMANQNTDDIFKNRVAILDALQTDGPVQENFKNTKYNESAIDFLENRSLLNNRVAKVNGTLSEVNADLIKVNEAIMAGNEEIVAFNAEQIQTNNNLLAGIQPEKSSVEANANRIKGNQAKIANIQGKNDTYNAAMKDKHAAIKANRIKIEENAAAIKARRKEIIANRAVINENAAKVAELLKGGVASTMELLKDMEGLSEDDKKTVAAALEGGETDAVAANRKNISENEARLHELHIDVMTNKMKLYAIRSIIEENRCLVLKNYTGAFIGNRQAANQNTDDIFKNRISILDALKVENQIQENFRNSKYNEANADFLEHRSKLNNRVQKVNEMMTAVNAKMIDANTAIMNSNEEIVKFNTAQIETNKKLLEGILPEKCTPEANAARIESNAGRIKVIADRCAKYEDQVLAMMQKVVENRTLLETNAKLIDERRDQIINNRVSIYTNGQTVAKYLREQSA